MEINRQTSTASKMLKALYETVVVKRVAEPCK